MSASATRLKLFKNGCQTEGGKMVLFPKSFEDLLETAKRQLSMEAVRIFTMDGAEVDNILLLRDDESVFVSAGEAFIDPSSSLSSVAPCYAKNSLESKCSGPSNSEWVTLNVGGTRFVTTRTTLTKDPDSMLARMFSSEDCTWYSRVDGEGAYLIDRSPVYFEPILNYLRQGTLILGERTDLKGVLEEAKFFGLSKVADELEHKIKEKKTSIFPMERDEFVRILLSTPSICELRCQGINLAGADLSNLDLRYINFKLASLAGCDLTGANFGSSCLERADLTGACLDEANLSNVKMSRANLEGASLIKCNFEDPTGHKANLEGANLKGATLEGCQMTGINLRLANLKGANMQNSVLHDAVLAGADLENCNLTGCDLQGANLRGANVVGTVFLNITTPLHMVHLM